MIETTDQGIEFKHKPKIYQLRPYLIKFMNIFLSKFYVGIWLYTWGAERRNLFCKFLGRKKRTIEKGIAFFWTSDDCTKENDEKLYKT